ncbi:MAG TPA: glycosyltransferase family 39 protein [Pyrinomonadaceae bacterium]|nr:glycosyltransferase family 39 protein [Pyrinomonadaceae bacterium]
MTFPHARVEAAPPGARDDARPASLPPEQNFLSQWRWWLPVAAVSLLLALLFLDPFAGDWDALDYTVLALQPEPSSMLLGRMLFIFTNHLLFRAARALFGLQAEHAYLLFKYFVVAQTPLAVAAFWALARDLTGGARAATASAVLLALSPYFVIYSGQAMTEIPSVLLLSLALLVHLRGLRRRNFWMVVAGAALLGLGVNVREGLALYGLWLVCAPLASGWRFRAGELLTTAAACAVFFALALGPFAYWYLADVNGYAAKWHAWVESSRMESARHPVSLENFRVLLLWFFVASPLALVALPAASFAEWRRRGFTPLLALALVGLFSNLVLITHYSVVINGRYVLTGLPGVLPLVADYFLRAEFRRTKDDRRAFARVLAGVVSVALLVGYVMYDRAWSRVAGHAMTGEYRARLALLPSDAVVMAGGQTVAVSFWRGMGVGGWDWIGTGGGWPGDEQRLVETIQNYLRQGRRVFLDTDPALWSPHGWQLEETRAVANLETHFRFRRHSDTLYEIRPADDTAAPDRPELERLLPENRR